MATSAFPALAVNTQGESPINLLGKIEQIKGAQQAQQMGAINLQEARVAQQSREALMAAYANNNGDLNQTLADARASGKVTPTDLMNFQTHAVDIQTKAALLSKANLENEDKTNDILANHLESFKQIPEAQRTPGNVKDLMGSLAGQGVDISKYMGTFQALAQNPSNDNLNTIELGLKGRQWVLNNEKAQREAASAPTVTQAQAKTQAEVSKAQDEAAAAHINLLSMPSPSEATTIRAANLLKTQAETAAANATTAEKKAQTALLGAEPVIAFDPATQQRVLTTMPQAKAANLTNPVKVSEADISKETEATKQFNDVQMNVSKYKLAFKNSSTMNILDAAKVGQILSDNNLMGKLGESPGLGITGDVIKDTTNARDWNALSPQDQDLVIGYLRAKGSIIAYQKALTQTGRTSAEAMQIEMNNLPSPIEGATVGLRRLESFQQNIDVASQGQTKVPWLPTTRQVRDLVENQTEKPRTPDVTEQLQKNLRMGAFNPPPLPDLMK